MWIGWSVAIISASIIILSVVTIIIVDLYGKQLENTRDYFWGERNRSDYHNISWRVADAKYCKYKPEVGYWICSIMIGLFAFALLIGIGVGIAHEVQPKHELIQFEETKAIVEQAYENGAGFDNVAITQMVIEKNQWIADVKASLRKYGKWSIYWGFDIDSVEPIVLHKQGD